MLIRREPHLISDLEWIRLLSFCHSALLDHPALAALQKRRQQRRVLALQLLDLLQRLRRIQLGRQQQPEGLLQHLQALRRKSPPRETNLVNPEGLTSEEHTSELQ